MTQEKGVEIKVESIIQSYVDKLAQSTQDNIMLSLENKRLREIIAELQPEIVEETK